MNKVVVVVPITKMLSSSLLFATLLLLIGTALSAPIGQRRDPVKEEEANKIALETTGELIPQSRMVEKIKSDLELIRYLDKGLEKRIHTGKWKPGQVLVRDISQEQLREVEGSEFKPVKEIIKNSDDTVLVFAKPYHPDQLARLLKLRFGFDSKPNNIVAKGDQILYRDDLSTYYWNSVNGKDCEKGCLAQYAVSIDVDKEDVDFYRNGVDTNNIYL